MKKVICLIVIISLLLSGCYDSGGANSVNKETNRFIQINNLLSYDKYTKIVYYYFICNEGTHYVTSYMSPYYSENGRLCQYDLNEDKIIEIK
jgi:hypothetical protein